MNINEADTCIEMINNINGLGCFCMRGVGPERNLYWIHLVFKENQEKTFVFDDMNDLLNYLVDKKCITIEMATYYKLKA